MRSAQKLAKADEPAGNKHELVNMIIECCSQERVFLRYYGLVSQRFCLMHRRRRLAFERAFGEQYATIRHLETNKLRNVVNLFRHPMHADALPWTCFRHVRLSEDETTSSSRIFMKIPVPASS